MYLIDTSVWIDYFREIKNTATEKFSFILDQELPFGITGIIYQEILQGASSEDDFLRLQTYLITQRFFHPQDEIITYQFAAKLFYQCRRKGITIRSTLDCLIAQIALENNLVLLHNDSDYKRIQSVEPKLALM